VALSGEREIDEEALGVRLLEDVRAVFGARGVDRAASKWLAGELAALEEAPWGETDEKGRTLDARRLARLLAPFEVRPRTIHFADKTSAKGYLREQFLDAWDRYCAPPGAPDGAPPGDPPATPSEGPSVPSDASRTSERPNPHGDGRNKRTDGSGAKPYPSAENPHGEPVRTDGRIGVRQDGSGPIGDDPRQARWDDLAGRSCGRCGAPWSGLGSLCDGCVEAAESGAREREPR
jgi:hypothetical protein